MLGNREQARIRREARRLRVSVQDMMEAGRGKMDNHNPGKLPKEPGAHDRTEAR